MWNTPVTMTMKKRTMKVLLLQLVVDGGTEVVFEVRQVLAQDVHLLVVDVGAWTLASVFVGHWLVINFDAEVVLGYIVCLIEQYVTDELCNINFLFVALDVVNGQLAKFNIHNLFVFGFRRVNRLTLFVVILYCFYFCDGCGHLVGCRQVGMVVVIPRQW